jgi:hypothetical protein
MAIIGELGHYNDAETIYFERCTSGHLRSLLLQMEWISATTKMGKKTVL